MLATGRVRLVASLKFTLVDCLLSVWDLNRSVQHLTPNIGEEDVAYEEVSTEDLLHRSRQSLDVGPLAHWCVRLIMYLVVPEQRQAFRGYRRSYYVAGITKQIFTAD